MLTPLHRDRFMSPAAGAYDLCVALCGSKWALH